MTVLEVAGGAEESFLKAADGRSFVGFGGGIEGLEEVELQER